MTERAVWAGWPPVPPGTWAVLVEADDVEECPEYGGATVIVYPPSADPEDLDAIPEAPSCMFSKGNSTLDIPKLVKCVTEGLKGDQPIFLYFDDMEDAVTCRARLRALGCALDRVQA